MSPNLYQQCVLQKLHSLDVGKVPQWSPQMWLRRMRVKVGSTHAHRKQWKSVYLFMKITKYVSQRISRKIITIASQRTVLFFQILPFCKWVLFIVICCVFYCSILYWMCWEQMNYFVLFMECWNIREYI